MMKAKSTSHSPLIKSRIPITIGIILLLITIVVVLGLFSLQSQPKTAIPTGKVSIVEKINNQSTCLINNMQQGSSSFNSEDRCSTDIYLKDGSNGKESFMFTTDNVVKPGSDSRVPEYREGQIFLVKRVGNSNYPSTDWHDELWVYKNTNSGMKIYEGKGFTYLPNDPGNKIAIIDTASDTPTTNALSNMLILISNEGDILKKLTLENLKTPPSQEGVSFSIYSDGWNNETLWLTAMWGQNANHYIALNTNDFTVKTYNISEIDIKSRLGR